MPELPEVESLARFLTEQAGGQMIERAELAALAALKTWDPPLSALVGETVTGAIRRGKFLCVSTTGPWLVMHLARGGWVQWRDAVSANRTKPGKGPLALRIALEGGTGFEVTEMGTEKRLALHVVARPEDVGFLSSLGPEVLAPGFGPDELGAILTSDANKARNLKTVLVDQSQLAGVGNAYSDEALHTAKLSPFKPAGKLNHDELTNLHAAVVGVLTDAIERSLGLPAKGLKAEKKAGLRVHGRTGETCPVCGDTIREVSFATKSLQYCATCQTGGKPLADRRLSRLLK